MDNEIKTWLFDILQSIKEIESYYEDKPKIYEEYLEDIYLALIIPTSKSVDNTPNKFAYECYSCFYSNVN